MPATVQAQWFGASASLPSGVNAETGVTWNREDTQTGLTPIPIPVSAAVNFSYLKILQLSITVASGNTTSLLNRTIRLSTTMATGLGFHWKTDTQANWGTAFNQQGGTKAPSDTIGTNNAASAPSGYTAATTSSVQYDNTNQNPTVTGIGSGPLLAVLLAVDATYTGGPGTATLPNIILGYDES